MCYTFLIASNEPLPDKENPYDRNIGLIETNEIGAELDPETIKYIENLDEMKMTIEEREELLEYPSIFQSDLFFYLNSISDKKYAVEIDGDIIGHPEVLSNYLKEQLETTDEMEFWIIWDDIDADEDHQKMEEISSQEIDEKLMDLITQTEEDYHCIKIRKK